MRSISLPFSEVAGISVPTLWLRDNCPCAECRVESTEEHRVLISAVATTEAPLIEEADDAHLVINWGDHRSVYTRSWFDQVCRDARRTHPDPEPWTAATLELPTYEYDLLDDDAVAAECFEAAGRAGAALVRSVPAEAGFLEQFIERWAPARKVALGYIHDVCHDPAGYNIAHSSEALPPHNDMASYTRPPSGQIIHMLVNDAMGGESTLVDGFAIASQLDEEDVDVLCRTAVGFRQFSSTADTWAKAPILQRDSRGRITHFRFSNQLLQPLDPFDPETATFYDSYRRLCERVTDPDNRYEFRMGSGDLLLLNGHRVLHGRTAFQPATGARHLQDIYFEFEDLLNEAHRLRSVRP